MEEEGYDDQPAQQATSHCVGDTGELFSCVTLTALIRVTMSDICLPLAEASSIL